MPAPLSETSPSLPAANVGMPAALPQHGGMNWSGNQWTSIPMQLPQIIEEKKTTVIHQPTAFPLTVFAKHQFGVISSVRGPVSSELLHKYHYYCGCVFPWLDSTRSRGLIHLNSCIATVYLVTPLGHYRQTCDS